VSQVTNQTTFHHLLISILVLMSPHLLANKNPSSSASPTDKANDSKAMLETKNVPDYSSENETPDDMEFRRKLALMAANTEKSVKLLREQIVQNQSAPFLADLYLQLADLLAQKSNILYYQQTEKNKNVSIKINANSKMNPIVTAQQEAIVVYQQILKEFPSFEKRDKVLYRLALSQKSIDEIPAFMATSEKLIREYPKTKEAVQAGLLIAQQHYDLREFGDAQKVLEPIKNSVFPFERNAARYRIGLIMIQQERFPEALKYFEQVASDDEFKDEDNPLEVSLQARSIKNNLKREALIDSVRAYTEVFKKNADPVGYYGKIAPTESLFQETIEKLAYRYIFLKNETQAMKLLRVLSERVSDPQKIVNIYQEVLLMIPLNDRIEVPFQEMQFVLSKYDQWISYFEVPAKLKEESYKFFETQIREMGTKSHDIGKSELSQSRKDILFERARNFYHLYLGFFRDGPDAVKIATNLADVYYYQKNYLQSGDYYLRIYQAEFGPPTNKEDLLQNAILCFQKKSPNDYYELTRTKGLLVKAIKTYMELQKTKKNDPQLNFVLAKTTYEQGLYTVALEDLLSFLKNYPHAKNESEGAADLILDYFNTRSDFKGLVKWTQKILTLPKLSADLRKRMETVKAKALLKKLDEEVKNNKSYDAFAQGKIYFENALAQEDEAIRSVALEQALARSKAERDINTFLRAARAVAVAEKDLVKKAAIFFSMAEETLAIGRFYLTFEIWKQIYADTKFSANQRKQAIEKSIRLSLMLKDWNKLGEYMGNNVWSGLNDTLKHSITTQLGEYMASPQILAGFNVPAGPLLFIDAENGMAFLHGQLKLNSSGQAKLQQTIAQKCRTNNSIALCDWSKATELTNKNIQFGKFLGTAPTQLVNIEPTANKFSGFISELKAIEGTGDPVLDIYGAMQVSKSYLDFAHYLQRVAGANKEVAPILNSKAAESLASAKASRQACNKIINTTTLISPINKYCLNGKDPSLREALQWPRYVRVASPRSDPKNKDIEELQKEIFAEKTKPELYLKLLEKYYQRGDYYHVVGLANFGISSFSNAKEDFSGYLGCALTQIGLYTEAQFHLKNSSDFGNLKNICLGLLKNKVSRL
jgi:tetratricopeptide (TPR) repeat protein